MNKEFNLKEKRERFFKDCIPNFVIHGNAPVLIIIKEQIEKQDKEFIKRLKKKLFGGSKKLSDNEMIDIIDKLSGDLEEKG